MEHHLATSSKNLRIGTRQRVELEPAIVAPWPAVEAEHERFLFQERREPNELSIAVGHAELRQSRTNLRHLIAVEDIRADAGDELIVGRLELRQKRARLTEIERKPLIQRSGKTVSLGKRLGKGLVDGFRLVQQRLRGQRIAAQLRIVAGDD